MAQQRGTAVALSYEAESTYGQLNSTTALKKLYYRSGIPAMSRELLASEVLDTARNPRKPVRGNVGVQWSTLTELSPQMGSMLKAALGSVNTTGASSPYTHTIKIATSIPSYTWEVGFTDLTAYLIYLGCKLNKLSLDIVPAGFQIMTMDWLGQCECQGLRFDGQTAAFNLNAIASGAGGNTGTIISQRDDGETGVLALFNHTGDFVNDEALVDNGTVPGAATVNGTLGDSSLDSSHTDPGHTPFDGFGISSLKEGGTTIAICSAITGLSIDNAIDPDNYVIGGGGRRRNLPEGRTTVSGTLEALFESMSLYNKAVRNTESSLEVIWINGTGAGTAGNEKLTLTVPELYFRPQTPPVEGPKGVRARLDFQAFYDNDAAASAIHAVLMNAEATI